jgi:large subunit ribosomal protein L25
MNIKSYVQSDVLKVSAQKRSQFGSKFSASLREQGLITARIDRCSENEHIIVDGKTFDNLLGKRALITHQFDIEIDCKIERVVLKDYQKCPVSNAIINLDFVKIYDDQSIKLRVPLFYINKSKSVAVKRGAFLNVAKYYVDLKFLGKNIVQYFILDLDESDVNSEYKVSDLPLPEGSMILRKGELFANFRGKRGQKLEAEAA